MFQTIRCLLKFLNAKKKLLNFKPEIFLKHKSSLKKKLNHLTKTIR